MNGVVGDGGKVHRVEVELEVRVRVGTGVSEA